MSIKRCFVPVARADKCWQVGLGWSWHGLRSAVHLCGAGRALRGSACSLCVGPVELFSTKRSCAAMQADGFWCRRPNLRSDVQAAQVTSRLWVSGCLVTTVSVVRCNQQFQVKTISWLVSPSCVSANKSPFDVGKFTIRCCQVQPSCLWLVARESAAALGELPGRSTVWPRYDPSVRSRPSSGAWKASLVQSSSRTSWTTLSGHMWSSGLTCSGRGFAEERLIGSSTRSSPVLRIDFSVVVFVAPVAVAVLLLRMFPSS